MAMKLSTGKIAFPIEFDNGDKDCIYFNPNDPNLIVNITSMQEKVNKRIQEIDDIELDAEGKPVNGAFADYLQSFQAVLYEELDLAFGGNISSVVFKHCSPFAVVGGEYFIVQFISAIIPEIKKCIQKANADIEKKMSKHLNKYTK